MWSSSSAPPAPGRTPAQLLGGHGWRVPGFSRGAACSSCRPGHCTMPGAFRSLPSRFCRDFCLICQVFGSFLMCRDKKSSCPLQYFAGDRSDSFCGATRLGAVFGAHSAHSNKCRHVVTACSPPSPLLAPGRVRFALPGPFHRLTLYRAHTARGSLGKARSCVLFPFLGLCP